MMMLIRRISESQRIHEVNDDEWEILRSRHRELFFLLFFERLDDDVNEKNFRITAYSRSER